MTRLLILMLLFLPAGALAQQPPSQPPQPDPPRRRPSMVGYLGNSSIGNLLRIRFDAGYGVDAADRAEFFYAKGGWYRNLAATHTWYDPAAAGPGPGVLEDLNFQQFYAMGEFAVQERVSLFAEVPLRWIQPQAFSAGSGSFDGAGGLSDVRVGVKLGVPGAMFADDRQLTLLFQVTAPTGDSRKGLGTNHASVEPALLYAARLSDRVGIEAQFGGVIPIGGSPGVPTSGPNKFSGGVVTYGIGPSFDLYTSDTLRFAPVVELVAWHVTGGFQTAAIPRAGGTDIVNLKVGGRVLARDRHSVYVGYGFALTDAVWYDDLLRFEYRLSF